MRRTLELGFEVLNYDAADGFGFAAEDYGVGGGHCGEAAVRGEGLFGLVNGNSTEGSKHGSLGMLGCVCTGGCERCGTPYPMGSKHVFTTWVRCGFCTERRVRDPEI